jgi:hypothetical protein
MQQGSQCCFIIAWCIDNDHEANGHASEYVKGEETGGSYLAHLVLAVYPNLTSLLPIRDS